MICSICREGFEDWILMVEHLRRTHPEEARNSLYKAEETTVPYAPYAIKPDEAARGTIVQLSTVTAGGT